MATVTHPPVNSSVVICDADAAKTTAAEGFAPCQPGCRWHDGTWCLCCYLLQTG